MACNETIEIIMHMEDEMKEKIPQKLITFLNKNKIREYRGILTLRTGLEVKVLEIKKENYLFTLFHFQFSFFNFQLKKFSIDR